MALVGLLQGGAGHFKKESRTFHLLQFFQVIAGFYRIIKVGIHFRF